MQMKKNGSVVEIAIEGPIGENSKVFTVDLRDTTRIVLDLEKVTYINSIGVKNWILWTVRVPPKAEFILKNVPLVIVNQASMVVGFIPDNGVIESFSAPYVCPSCNTEKMVSLRRGEHYQYATNTSSRMLNLPALKCPKCGAEMEPDFIEMKTCAFLDRKQG